MSCDLFATFIKTKINVVLHLTNEEGPVTVALIVFNVLDLDNLYNACVNELFLFR